jgi:hypothetical protein
VIDTGAHFFGSGLFYPVFGLKPSASFFAAVGYDAYGLSYRDFAAGVSGSDTSGAQGLAEYISHARVLDPTLPPAVATNINTTGDPYLDSSHITPYTLVSLPGGKVMAVLALIGPEDIPASFVDRIMPYERALQVALAKLRRLPSCTGCCSVDTLREYDVGRGRE